MSNCLDLLPILSRPEYRIRWANTSTINLYYNPVSKRLMTDRGSGNSEIINLGAGLIVEERYKVTQFVIGGPAVGSWTPWARTIRLPIANAQLKLYVRADGQNWFEIAADGTVNVNLTNIQNLSGLRKLDAKAVIKVTGGVFACQTEVSTTAPRDINVVRSIPTSTSWSANSSGLNVGAYIVKVFKTKTGFLSVSPVNGSTSSSSQINLTGKTQYMSPFTSATEIIASSEQSSTHKLLIRSTLHPGQTFISSPQFNLNLLKAGLHTLVLDYIGEEGMAKSSSQRLFLEIIDCNISLNLSACNIPSGKIPQEFKLPSFSLPYPVRWFPKRLDGTGMFKTNKICYLNDANQTICSDYTSTITPRIEQSLSAAALNNILFKMTRVQSSFFEYSIIAYKKCPRISVGGTTSYEFDLYVGVSNTPIPFTVSFKL